MLAFGPLDTAHKNTPSDKTFSYIEDCLLRLRFGKRRGPFFE